MLCFSFNLVLILGVHFTSCSKLREISEILFLSDRNLPAPRLSRNYLITSSKFMGSIMPPRGSCCLQRPACVGRNHPSRKWVQITIAESFHQSPSSAALPPATLIQPPVSSKTRGTRHYAYYDVQKNVLLFAFFY